MAYHLPRAALWKQQEAVAYVPNAPDERIDTFPPVAEIEVTWSMILGDGDGFVTCVQLLALVGACVAIFGIATRLGLGERAAAFGALAFPTFTVVALQAPTALNDIVVAALLIICAYFAMGASRVELALAAVSLALAVGTKGTVIFALPVLALFALASQPRSRQPRIIAVGAASLAVGSFWFVVNLLEAGDLTGGTGLDRGRDPPLERIRLSVVDMLEASETAGTGLLGSTAFRLSALTLAAIVAIGLAIGGRRRASIAALLTGVVAFFSLPLLARWVDIGHRAIAEVGAVVGIGNGPAERLPVGYYESPMHSSYGLAFVVLFFGAGALVVADVARRRLAPVALVPLAGVPVALALSSALAIARDTPACPPSRRSLLPWHEPSSASHCVLDRLPGRRRRSGDSPCASRSRVGYAASRPGGALECYRVTAIRRDPLAGSSRVRARPGIPRHSASSRKTSRQTPHSRSTSLPARISTPPGTAVFAEPWSSSPRAGTSPRRRSGSSSALPDRGRDRGRRRRLDARTCVGRGLADLQPLRCGPGRPEVRRRRLGEPPSDLPTSLAGVGTLLLALGVALVVGAGALVASCLGVRSTIGLLLAVYLLASGEVVIVSLGLSPVDALTRRALLVVFGGWFALAWIAWMVRGRPRAPFVFVAPMRRRCATGRSRSSRRWRSWLTDTRSPLL